MFSQLFTAFSELFVFHFRFTLVSLLAGRSLRWNRKDIAADFVVSYAAQLISISLREFSL